MTARHRAFLVIGGGAAACLLFGAGWALRGLQPPIPHLDGPKAPAAPQSWKYPGWEYKRDGYRNMIRFHFADRENTQFIVFCDRWPVLGFDPTSGPGNARTFDLTIDAQTWTRPIVRCTECGNGTLIAEPAFADRLAKARKQISIRIGNWQRTLKPVPELAWFVDECRAMRKRDPDATGKGSEF